METPLILSSGQEAESFGAVALYLSPAVCLTSQDFLNGKQFLVGGHGS